MQFIVHSLKQRRVSHFRSRQKWTRWCEKLSQRSSQLSSGTFSAQRSGVEEAKVDRHLLLDVAVTDRGMEMRRASGGQLVFH